MIKRNLKIIIILLIVFFIIFLYFLGNKNKNINIVQENQENIVDEKIKSQELGKEKKKEQMEKEEISFEYTDKEYVRMKTRDAKRASDIKKIQLGVEIFYDVKGRYPGLYGTESRDIMKKETESENIIDKVPEDPGEYEYFYVPFEDAYVLGATFEQEDHYLLEKDFDNFDNKNIKLPKNFTCEDPVFCVTSF